MLLKRYEEDGLSMGSPGSRRGMNSLQGTILPVIVRTVIIINLGILTGISRFG
jgi:hypothetical protein